MNKKLISRLLLLALLFSLYTGRAFAAGEDVQDEDVTEITGQEESCSGEEDAAPPDEIDPDEDYEDDEEESEEYPEINDGDVNAAEAAYFDKEGKSGYCILCKKVDLNSFFGEVTGEKKYELSNKKIGKVSKKGILTIKKAGDVDVYCYVKEDGKWTKAAELFFVVKIPEPSMKTIPAGALYSEGQTLELSDYIINNNGLEAHNWMIKADPEVATLDSETGVLTAGKKSGKAVVYAEYPCTFYGEYGKDPYARQLKFTVKIDHKKISLADSFEIPDGAKTRYTVSNKKIATISKKGVLSFKKEGGITVNVQFKDGKNWLYKDTKACSYTLKKSGEYYSIEEGRTAREMDAEGSYTTKEDVSDYIHSYERLPQNFITKKLAKDLGWPGGGLDPYAYGKCIGGDYYGNYDGTLPEGDYRECDIDTLHKKDRGAKRLVYDVLDGDIYYTSDHYKTFIQLY